MPALRFPCSPWTTMTFVETPSACLIQELEVALAGNPRCREIGADVGDRDLARACLDYYRARNAGLGHDDVVALLPADGEPVSSSNTRMGVR